MKFVLRDDSGRFFISEGEYSKSLTCSQVADASVFHLIVNDGQFFVNSPLPEGDWQIVPIKITIEV